MLFDFFFLTYWHHHHFSLFVWTVSWWSTDWNSCVKLHAMSCSCIHLCIYIYSFHKKNQHILHTYVSLQLKVQDWKQLAFTEPDVQPLSKWIKPFAAFPYHILISYTMTNAMVIGPCLLPVFPKIMGTRLGNPWGKYDTVFSRNENQ